MIVYLMLFTFFHNTMGQVLVLTCTVYFLYNPSLHIQLLRIFTVFMESFRLV